MIQSKKTFSEKQRQVDKSSMFIFRQIFKQTFKQFQIEQEDNTVDEKLKDLFQEIFLYGKSLTMYRNEKLKKVQLYIDRNYEHLIWISTKSKAFVIDMQFTTLRYFTNQQLSKKYKRNFTLMSFGQSFAFVFQENENEQMISLIESIENYIKWCRKKNSYTAFYSRILRMYAIEGTRMSGGFKMSEIINITKKIGFVGEKDSQNIMKECIKKYKCNQNDIIQRNVLDDYLKIINCSDGLKEVFEKYSNKKITHHMDKLEQILPKQNFKQFLLIEQGETQNLDRILKLYSEKISLYEFCTFIQSSTSNYIASPSKLDQSHPLNHYFCFSSHNTYLTGNQIWSQSSIERYTQDLQQGIKCVEIDVHNDGDQLVVTHALKDRSLTSKIPFEGVIRAIDKYTDKQKDHLPIILSIQNHARDDNKEKMLNLLTSMLNKKLYYYDPKQKSFPTLFSLRQKIIIKTSSLISEVTNVKPQQKNQNKGSSHNYSLKPQLQSNEHFHDKNFQLKYEKFHKYTVKQFQQKKQKFNLQMDNMKNLFLPLASMTKVTSIFKAPHGVPLEVKPETLTPFQCVSLVNQKVAKIPFNLMVQCTRRIWVRTYPHALQMASNNYNPCEMLNVGAQIIALNTQTKDKYASLMKSYFKSGRNQSSKLGYILKPEYLLNGSAIPKRKMKVQIRQIQKYDHSIKVQFFGLEKQMAINKNSQGIFITENPDVSFLVIEASDNYFDCIPFRYIRRGYRVIVLRNEDFIDSSRRIIIHITISEK